MDVLILLDKLDDLIYNSKPIPLTDQVRVEREEVYAILDQIRVTLPEEIKQARWIVQEHQEVQEDQSENRYLQSIARSIEELKRSQRPAPPPLTAAAAEKVRSIVEAAEASALEVRAEADREARRIEGDAARRGMEMRKRSAAEATDRLKRADELTKALLAEAGAASADIEALLDRVRGPAAALADVLGDGAARVRADFDRMRARVAEEADPGAGRPQPSQAPVAEPDPASDGQPTEEWDYYEADAGGAPGEVVEGAEPEPEVHGALPGPGAHVTAGRLGAGEEAPGRTSAEAPAEPLEEQPEQR